MELCQWLPFCTEAARESLRASYHSRLQIASVLECRVAYRGWQDTQQGLQLLERNGIDVDAFFADLDRDVLAGILADQGGEYFDRVT